MSHFNHDPDRKLVPRWRSYNDAIRFGEVGSLSLSKASGVDVTSLVDILDEWEAQQTLMVAAELCSSALASFQPQAASDSARFILSNDCAPAGAKLIARKCLEEANGTFSFPSISEMFSQPQSPQMIGASIHRCRIWLNDAPHNPILWTNLALNFLTLGHPTKAHKAMRVALALSKDNRFILRAASRLYLHSGDPEKAHEVLLRSATTSKDPWLLASEIVMSELCNKTSKNMRVAKSTIDSKSHLPLNISELAGALATIEASAGHSKSARNLCDVSLVNPSENAIAQVAWLNRTILTIHSKSLDNVMSRSSEADAWAALENGQWEVSLAESKEWFGEQPFSSRPALLAGFVESVVFERFEDAEKTLKSGLVANREDTVILNNLAATLANQGKIREARDTIEQIDKIDNFPGLEICLDATRGLIDYRDGNRERGRAFYQKAIDLASKGTNDRLKAVALIHYAIEEIRIGSELTESLTEMAIAATDKLEHRYAFLFRKKIAYAKGKMSSQSDRLKLVDVDASDIVHSVS